MMKILLLTFILIVTFFDGNSQSVKVYFTKSVDNSVSSVTDAQNSSSLDDTIVSIIDATLTNLDIAVWDNGSSVIVTALNNAYARGVQVRYITSDNALNSALSGLNSNIPVLQRDATLTSNVMHNKFIIADNAKILMGSMNFGNGSMYDDYNNVVIIEDVPLALNYLTEFNEMWGDVGAQPNLTNSKFGPDKTDNTIHTFTINGSVFESYFSPTDNTTLKIVDAINTADVTLDVALFTFTNNDLGDAVIAAKNRGVNVRVIMENESYIGSEYNGLVAAGIPVISHESIAYDFHHKYCVIDAATPTSDPIVVTGSHNWTNSAEDEYDENTLIIHDAIVAGNYQEEFAARWNELGGAAVSEQIINSNNFNVIINPSEIYITNEKNLPFEIKIYDLTGKLIKNSLTNQNGNVISIAEMESGMYLLYLADGKNEEILKFVKQ